VCNRLIRSYVDDTILRMIGREQHLPYIRCTRIYGEMAVTLASPSVSVLLSVVSGRLAKEMSLIIIGSRPISFS
jgi:hypothetical protein